MVAWRNHDIGLGVDFLDSPTHIGDTWGRIAAAWFAEDVPHRNLGQLLVYDIRVFGIGDHPDIFGGADAFEALEGELKECFPHS